MYTVASYDITTHYEINILTLNDLNSVHECLTSANDIQFQYIHRGWDVFLNSSILA